MDYLDMTDIKLDVDWKLTAAASGDAPVVSGLDCLLQDIKHEALCQEGEIFYDEEYGWSLMDFIHSEDDELTIVEIKQRVEMKLGRREIVDSSTVSSEVVFTEDRLTILASFRFVDSDQVQTISVDLDRVKAEVIIA